MPGTTALTFSDQMLSVQGFHRLAAVMAAKDVPYPVADDAFKLGKEDIEGGERLVIPYEVDDHSRPTKITVSAGGYGGIDLWAQSTFKPGHESWAYVVQPVFISETDKAINRGREKVLDIWQSRVENVARMQQRNYQNATVKGAVASGTWGGVPGWEDWLPLNGADNATGLLEARTSGTNTVHNVSRSSYPATTHPKLHNIYFTAQDAANTYLQAAIFRARAQAQSRGANIGGGSYRAYVSEEFEVNISRILNGRVQYIMAGKSGQDVAADAVVPYILGAPTRALATGLPQAGATSGGSASTKWGYIGVTWGKGGISLKAQSGYMFKMGKVESIPGTNGVQLALFHNFGQNVCQVAGTNIVGVGCETY